MRYHPSAAPLLIYNAQASIYPESRRQQAQLGNGVPTSPGQLRKLGTLNEAVAKALTCLDFTTAYYKPCQAISTKIARKIYSLAKLLVNRRFRNFQVPAETQRIQTNCEFGIYFAIVGNHPKVGCSYTNMYKRVKTQIPDFDASNAICLMTPDQVQETIPNWIVKRTIELNLPGLQFHDSHKEKLENAIKTFWAELLCYACTNCPRGIVGERFLEVPNARVREAFEPMSAEDFDQDALKILKSKNHFHFLQTWPTISSILAALAEKGDETLRQRLAMLGREHEYPTKHLHMKTFDIGDGKRNSGLFFDAVDDNATVAVCQELVQQIEAVVGDRDVEDLSDDDQEKIRNLIRSPLVRRS